MDVWYAHPVYARYWHHYQQSINWHQRHKRTYKKAMEAAYMQSLFSMYPSAMQCYSDWHEDENCVNSDADGASPSEKRWKGKKKKLSCVDSEDSLDESQIEIECNVSNMDISEELRQYFALSEKHRQELKKQQMMAEQQDSYVLADHDLHRVSWLSTLPPSECPGERRSAEMKKLYGKDAAKIQGMETAVQLTFDRNCDKKQPKYWPVIPLNL